VVFRTLGRKEKGIHSFNRKIKRGRNRLLEIGVDERK
jgi:hypothetical protein